MKLQTKIELCYQKKIELEQACNSLLAAIRRELKGKAINKLAESMGKDKSYISKTLPRKIGFKKWPANIKPIMSIAKAIDYANQKKKDLEKI